MDDERIEKAAQAIRETCERLCAFLLEKNAAYGNSAFEPVGVFCKADAETLIRARLDDTISRLQRGQAAGEDTELDALGYLLLLRALPHYRELCAPAVEAPPALAAVGVRLRHKTAGWTGEITRQEHDSFVVSRDSDGVRLPYTWSQFSVVFDVEPFEARAEGEPGPKQAAIDAVNDVRNACRDVAFHGVGSAPPRDPWQPGVEVERIAGSLDPAVFFAGGDRGWITERRAEGASIMVLVRRQRDGFVFEFSPERMARLFRVVEPKEGARP